MTGSTCVSAELSPKKLQFLTETVPGAARIAVLFNPDDPGIPPSVLAQANVIVE